MNFSRCSAHKHIIECIDFQERSDGECVDVDVSEVMTDGANISHSITLSLMC